jgi:tetratricopeptide (TPR) repeat protein
VLAPFAATGVDYSTVMYDPTNGSLGLGDFVLWTGKSKREEVFKPLDEAWNLIQTRSPLVPMDPESFKQQGRQSIADAHAAQKLFDEGNDLAALALASRATLNLPPNPVNWDSDERHAGTLRGLAAYNLGNPRLAADLLIEAFQSQPNDVEAHYYFAAASFLAGDAPGSLLHFTIAAQIDPKSPYTAQAEQNAAVVQNGNTPLLPPARSAKPAAASASSGH